jgi:transposase-like protein
MKKVPPSEKLSKEIKGALSGACTGQEDLLEVLIEKSVRMVMQRILEQEVTDYLGRGYFERNSDSRRGHRNGYEDKSLKTAEGRFHLDVPQVAGIRGDLQVGVSQKSGWLESGVKAFSD